MTGTDYLAECFRSAREELLQRVKQRDAWLKLQLLSQAVLFALSEGVPFAEVKAERPRPEFLSLALPLSFVFVCLYLVEDCLLHRLSKYIGRLSKKEAELRSSAHVIENWDISPELRSYTKLPLKLRIVAQLAAFVIVPALITWSEITKWSSVMAGFQASLFFGILAVLVFGYVQRRSTGEPD